ncbi:C39 family peptidase [Enterococcus cecorum]|nr:C39 family peptidase [Enterococcus cecorum]
MKKTKKLALLLLLCILLLFFFLRLKDNHSPIVDDLVTQLENTVVGLEVKFSFGPKVQMDVPLESQFDEPSLQNGCEITALSMLLRYYGYHVNKNQLAKQLNYVPLKVDDTYYGDPNEGFVGNIKEGKQAMGAWSAPIKAVAEQIVGDNYTVHDEPISFTKLKKLINQSTPVWILATLELKVPSDSDFIEWPTKNGTRIVTPKIHSAVITGMHGQYFYVNDPYGYKNRRVKQKDLQQIYERMGCQLIYLEKNG